MKDIKIPNATVEYIEIEGLLPFYKVTPDKQCLLHDNILDTRVLDENGLPTDNVIYGYYPSSRTFAADYDFENTKEINGYTAYGERELFVIKEENTNERDDYIC